MDRAVYPKVKFTEEEVLTLTDNKGNSVYFIEHDGYYLSKRAIEKGIIPDPRINIPSTINMKIRKDDIFLLAYPKAGTHWTWEIAKMLLNKDAEHIKHVKEIAMLPFRTPEHLDEIPSPRILNSHMYFRHLPEDILKHRNKIIFVNRNPKDIAVSFYHHCKHVLDYKGTFSDFLTLFTTENKDYMYHCPLHMYLSDMERVFKQHPELPLLVLNYEDLHKDPINEVKRIAEFLAVENTEDFYKDVVEKCSFHQLKKSYTNRDSRNFMFRKGGVSDWKNWFTVADNEKFDKYLDEKYRNLTWKFTYSID